MYQRWVLHPADHEQVVAGVLGRHELDVRAGIRRDEGGWPTAEANPWAQQMAADLVYLADLDEGRDLMNLLGGSMLSLFSDAEAREMFVQMDMSQLRT